MIEWGWRTPKPEVVRGDHRQAVPATEVTSEDVMPSVAKSYKPSGPLFQRANPNGYAEPNPPCERTYRPWGRRWEARQHVGCNRTYFSASWMKSRTWTKRYSAEARAAYWETRPEYEQARIVNRCLGCEDCLAEYFGLHPSEARAIINRVLRNGFATHAGERIKQVDLRTIPSRPEGAPPIGDLLKVPSDEFDLVDDEDVRW